MLDACWFRLFGGIEYIGVMRIAGRDVENWFKFWPTAGVATIIGIPLSYGTAGRGHVNTFIGCSEDALLIVALFVQGRQLM